MVKQKNQHEYSYCGLFKYDEYFVGTEDEYIKKVGTTALKNSGIVLYDPIEDSNVLVSLINGNCLITVLAEGRYLIKSELKKELLKVISNKSKT